jgi:hypothetical protein
VCVEYTLELFSIDCYIYTPSERLTAPCINNNSQLTVSSFKKIPASRLPILQGSLQASDPQLWLYINIFALPVPHIALQITSPCSALHHVVSPPPLPLRSTVTSLLTLLWPGKQSAYRYVLCDVHRKWLLAYILSDDSAFWCTFSATIVPSGVHSER